ncbi:hypothetical protein [Ligilactobacillus apodemi]|uniref:hypothetical protein n=1 Tax=Ligilactobacillus apodemi TaxID=307126 RepID=UPI00046A3641|nr:hypothetical protein [Ligilactobacillus apodemi]
MIQTIPKEFQKLSSYLLNKVEIGRGVDKFDGKMLKEMFASSARQKFARSLLKLLYRASNFKARIY